MFYKSNDSVYVVLMFEDLDTETCSIISGCSRIKDEIKG